MCLESFVGELVMFSSQVAPSFQNDCTLFWVGLGTRLQRWGKAIQETACVRVYLGSDPL